MSLRNEATILMGKNTMIRKAVRDMLEEHPEFERLLHVLKGNVGFVFTNKDLKDVREKIVGNRVRAPAKAGAVAPDDVFVPAGPTGMDPGKTSFFQALGIPTKIAKGAIEIVNQVHLIKAGNKVGPSEAALLNMMNISPFTYGLTIDCVYDDGVVFDASILDVDDEQLIGNLMSGIQRVAALSMAIHYPTVASVPHLMINGYKNVLSVALATECSFEQADKV
jgi:large subunit ribosomal protein LP0